MLDRRSEDRTTVRHDGSLSSFLNMKMENGGKIYIMEYRLPPPPPKKIEVIVI